MTIMNKTELKKTVTKIKKFLKQRDYEAINTGVELARGLNDPTVFESLLKDCAIGKTSAPAPLGYSSVQTVEAGLVRSKAFSGSGPAQPYLDYALVNLIAYAPEGAKVHESLVRSNIRTLTLGGRSWLELPKGFEGFENLTSLDLGYSDSLQNVDGLTKCKQLTSLNLTMWKSSSLQNVDGLANCTQLTSLSLCGCKALQNVDGLANLTQLTSLSLDFCEQLDISPSLKRLRTREEVAAYQELIKKSMK
jgi:Leucine-rich repeat (LRR) protein